MEYWNKLIVFLLRACNFLATTGFGKILSDKDRKNNAACCSFYIIVRL